MVKRAVTIRRKLLVQPPEKPIWQHGLMIRCMYNSRTSFCGVAGDLIGRPYISVRKRALYQRFLNHIKATTGLVNSQSSSMCAVPWCLRQ